MKTTQRYFFASYNYWCDNEGIGSANAAFQQPHFPNSRLLKEACIEQVREARPFNRISLVILSIQELSKIDYEQWLEGVLKEPTKLPEESPDLFIQGYVRAVCNLIRKRGMVTPYSKEMFHECAGQMTLSALMAKGVPDCDLDILEQNWPQLH